MNLHNIDAWEFIKTMPDKSVDAIITDPMYDQKMDMDELRRVCKGHIVMFCAPENPFFIPDERAYWIKTPSTKNYTKHLGRFVEWIIIERHGSVFNADLHWSNYTGVYEDMIFEKQIHPFEKPESLMSRLVHIFTKRGDAVFDPFFGSGSTGKACEKLGRDFVGCEINKEYFNQYAYQNIKLADLKGIAPNATGDLMSEDFVRNLREGW